MVDRRMWFYNDEWDYITQRGLLHGHLSIWSPHNEHWSTLPILAYRALLTVFGMNSYAPFLLLLVALHLALAHVLWRVSLRVGASPLIATSLAAVFVVLGSGYEDIDYAFQIGFVGSLLFGWIALWVTDHDDPFGRRDMAGWIAAIAALMCSAIGIPMMIVTGLAISIRRGVRAAAVAVSVPLVVLFMWYLAIGRDARRTTPITENTVLSIGTYAWLGINTALSNTIGFTGAGAIAAAALLYGLLRCPLPTPRRDAIARAGAIGIVPTFLFIGIGRSAFGTEQAGSSRYVYIAIALVLPASAMLLSQLFRPTMGQSLGFVLLCGIVCLINANALRTWDGSVTHVVDTYEQQILGSYDLANGGGFVFSNARTADYGTPPPAAHADAGGSDVQPTVADLREFRRNGWLKGHYNVAASVLLGDEARMQVGELGPGSQGPYSVPGFLSATEDVAVRPTDAGCVTLTPTGRSPIITVAPSDYPVLLTVSRATPGDISGVLVANGTSAKFPTLPVGVGSRVLLAATGTEARFRLPASGQTTVCGALGAP